ncbi:MAG TPA: glycosyltransferase, partial [Solirubrobacteraceae bacterium]
VSRCRLRSDDNVFVIPHGHYLDAYRPTALDRPTARAALGLPRDGTVLLFLGNLREHKGLGPLLDAFGTLDRPDVHLVIAGRPFSPDIGERLAARARAMARVDVRPGFVPADQVAVYMRAANAVVCPFTSSLTSGSVVLAMSFARACIAPRLGCIPDTLAPDGGVVYEPDGPAALAAALRAAVDRTSELDAMGARNRATVARRDWSRIAEATLDVYRRCLTARRPRSGTASRTA